MRTCPVRPRWPPGSVHDPPAGDLYRTGPSLGCPAQDPPDATAGGIDNIGELRQNGEQSPMEFLARIFAAVLTLSGATLGGWPLFEDDDYEDHETQVEE
jgi:hypothetical protein